METLAFSFKAAGAEHLDLFRVQEASISEDTWQELAANIANEPSLRPAPASILRERWQQGIATILVKDHRILCYSSLVPIFCQATRGDLSAALGLEPDSLPQVDVYGLSTGWTHPDWRRKGVHLQLNPPLFERFTTPHSFYIVVTVGMAGSPALEKLGMRMIAWSQIAFVSSLAGVAIAGFKDRIGKGWLAPPGMVQYEGEHVSFTPDSPHKWDRFCHLMVSNLPQAVEVNRRLAAALDGDLRRWREAIIDVFSTRAKSSWTLHLFQE